MKKRFAAFLAVAIAAGTLTAFVAGPSSAAGTTVLVAPLSGDNETTEGDPDGVGKARIVLIPASNRVCFRISWAKIQQPVAAHIHEGEAGTDGDIVVTLFDGAIPANIRLVGGCVRNVSKQLLAEIRSNPSAFYVNVHNEDYPAGAIRGQLTKPAA